MTVFDSTFQDSFLICPDCRFVWSGRFLNICGRHFKTASKYFIKNGHMETCFLYEAADRHVVSILCLSITAPA